MKSLPAGRAVACAVILAVTAAAVPAAIITSSPAWPSTSAPAGNIGYYLSGPTPSFSGGGLTITMDTALLRLLDPVNIVPSGPNENASFSSNLDVIGDVIPLANDLPSSSTGTGAMVTLGKTGNVIGTFQTELLSLNLSGATPLGPFLVRESPTLASTGQTAITDLGGGSYRIDSFFDVFMEVSIDNGANWFPNSNGSARFTLVPEPGSMLCVVLTGGLLLQRRRRV
jgi:hypothetical protein